MSRPVSVRITASGRSIDVPPGGSATVGRSPECDLVVDHPAVSRLHLTIRDAGGWLAVDSSANGTFLEHRAIAEIRVSNRSSLRLGDAVEGPIVDLVVDGAASEATGSVPIVGELIVGRDPTCDLVLDDLLVSRQHAVVRTTPDGTREIEDLGSHNGTYVNGVATTTARLADVDVVTIGRSRFRVAGTVLEPMRESGTVVLAAESIGVVSGDGTPLLRDIDLAVDRGAMVGVVGPSGAGKSTLLGALTGLRPATSGRVGVNGLDLYAEYAVLQHDIGLVPQDDVLHHGLRVRQALEFSAELSFPADATAAERSNRVSEVLDELGLAGQADLRVDELSGGQRKRVSVAQELLTAPAILFLDEPTSGLDPGAERSLMATLRGLADSGRTIVVVTHSVMSLGFCDRVLCLAVGGSTAYFGPPELAPAALGGEDYQQALQQLAEAPERPWADEFRRSDDYQTYVAAPLGQVRLSPPVGDERRTPRRPTRWLHQATVLTRRYARVMASDRRNLMLIALTAPLLGVLIWVVLPSGELGPLPAGQIRLVSQAPLVLFVLVVGITQLGASVAAREIVKESGVFRRERAKGLSISAYVASKAMVLGLVVAFQAVSLTVLATAGQNGPTGASALGWPLGELIVVVFLVGLAGATSGLLVSALSDTSDQAMTIVPVVVIIQLLLASGGVFPSITEKPVVREATYASSTRWGFDAAASTSSLNQIAGLNRVAAELPSIDLREPEKALDVLLDTDRGNPAWNHEAETWWRSVAAIATLAAAGLLATGLALRRKDPL